MIRYDLISNPISMRKASKITKCNQMRLRPHPSYRSETTCAKGIFSINIDKDWLQQQK